MRDLEEELVRGSGGGNGLIQRARVGARRGRRMIKKPTTYLSTKLYLRNFSLCVLMMMSQPHIKSIGECRCGSKCTGKEVLQEIVNIFMV
jgi:hypothetical protein